MRPDPPVRDPKRDWYWWRDDRGDADGGSGDPGSPGRAPNNWLSAFPGVGRTDLPSAWTWDETTSQWYLHLFLPGQPDLNWAHLEVKGGHGGHAALLDGAGSGRLPGRCRPWSGEGPRSPRRRPRAAGPARGVDQHDPATHPILAGLRSVIDEWPERPARMHRSFNFPPLFAPWEAAAWKACIDEVTARLDPAGAWPTWVLSNHVEPRHRSRYGSEAVARAAAVLLLTLRGAPFLYAGEEIGLSDAVVGPDRLVDPGDRDRCRAPIPWDATPGHGWVGGSDAWLPWPPEADKGRTTPRPRASSATNGSPATTAGCWAPGGGRRR